MSFVSIRVPTMKTTNIQKKTNLSVKVNLGVKSQLQHIAKEKTKQAFYKRAEDSLLHMRETGLHVTHEEVTDWLQSLKTDNPKPIPQCHK